MWLIALLIPVLNSGVNAETELTVERAVNLGLQNDETYLIAAEELERASGQIREAWSGALPRLDFNGRYTRNLEIQKVFVSFPEEMGGDQTFKMGTNHNYAFGLSLTQPIFLGGKVGGALKIARFYEAYAKHRLDQTRHDVVYEIKRKFFMAKLAGDVVAVYSDAIRQAELNYGNVEKLFDQGMASEFDLLRAEVELANLRPQLIKARNDSTLSILDLKNKLGLPDDEQIALSYQFDSTGYEETSDLEAGLSHASEQHPALLQQEYAVKGYEKAIGITKADRWPQVILQSSYDVVSQTDQFRPPHNSWSDSWSASVVMSFPIFDGRAVSGRVKQARANYNQSRYLERQIRENVLLAVRSAYMSWQEAVASLKSQKRTIAQAEEGLRIANLRYSNGIGTQLEVLAAQTANTQAKVNYIRAIYDYELAAAGFLKAAGYEPVGSGDER